MDQITQQNAASAEETASSSEELAAQAQTMKEQISMLSSQVGSNGNGSTHPLQDKPQVTRGRTSRSTSHAFTVSKTTTGAGIENRLSNIDPEEVIPMGNNGVEGF